MGNESPCPSSPNDQINSVLMAAIGLTDLGSPNIVSPSQPRALMPMADFMHPSMMYAARPTTSFEQSPYLDRIIINTNQLYSEQSHPMNGTSFPMRLFEIVSKDRHPDIISWLPHGQGFMIHDKTRFAETILPHYFDGTKFTSFTRRLKRWNFVRVSRGPELGAYYNKNFVRGKPADVKKMRYRITLEKRALAAKKKAEQEASDKNERSCEQEPEEECSFTRSVSSESGSLAMELMPDDLQCSPSSIEGKSDSQSKDDGAYYHPCPPPSRQQSFQDNSMSLHSSPNYQEHRTLDFNTHLALMKAMSSEAVSSGVTPLLRRTNNMMGIPCLPVYNPSFTTQPEMMEETRVSPRSNHKQTIDAAVRDLQSRMGLLSPNHRISIAEQSYARMPVRRDAQEYTYYLNCATHCYRASAA